MKDNKKLLLILLLIIAFLGIGYAVITGTRLNINGTASTADSEISVSFTGEVTVSNEDKVTASATANGITGTIDVTDLSSVGETASATYTLQNKETDLDAKISLQTITNNMEDFFEITTSVDENELLLPANSNDKKVTVTVKLIAQPTQEDFPVDSENKATIEIILNATPVQPS